MSNYRVKSLPGRIEPRNVEDGHTFWVYQPTGRVYRLPSRVPPLEVLALINNHLDKGWKCLVGDM